MASTSSGAALTRSRSLRNPNAANTNESNNGGGGGGGQHQQQSMSPSRLPVKGIGAGSASAATTPAGASSKVPPTTTTTARSARPLSGVFSGRSNSVRQPTTTTTRPTRAATMTARPTPTTSARPTSSSGVPASSGSRPLRAGGGAIGHGRTRSSATALTGATVLRPPQQQQQHDISTTSIASSSSSASIAPGPSDRTRHPPITRSAATTHRRQVSTSSVASSISTTTTTASKAPPSANSSSISTSRRPSSASYKPALPPTASTPSRASSSSSSVSASTTTAAQDRDTSSSSSNITSTRPLSISSSRPAFSTLQQHYSPAKHPLAPKPLTATFLAPPSPSKLPANVQASAETHRLQAELLQLHLLHRSAAGVDQEWRAGARSTLSARFGEVAAGAEQVSRLEAERLEGENAGVLLAWGGDDLEGKIQALDAVLCGLWSVCEPVGGRYTRVVRRFERWAERVEEVAEARRAWAGSRNNGDGGSSSLGGGNSGGGQSGRDQGEEKLLFVGGQRELDGAWREECAGLVRRLEEWKRREGDGSDDDDDNDGEKETDDPAPPSTLARVLSACRSLIHDMLAELEIMELMDREDVAEENAWIRSMNRDGEEGDGVGEEGNGQQSRAGAGAIWRML
ncbi:hypothetical protein B0T17DRAFT_529141 [Bombardia bombarda]|uniref:Uncharacterized protein n=1 Tax=Bombardia bombarda TaxID=252184 RepID=A0AA40CAY4_9PEZI|nr:hypothetical protein B0T17DRAFT_529141 [Bombardia bombarda]